MCPAVWPTTWVVPRHWIFVDFYRRIFLVFHSLIVCGFRSNFTPSLFNLSGTCVDIVGTRCLIIESREEILPTMPLKLQAVLAHRAMQVLRLQVEGDAALAVVPQRPVHQPIFVNYLINLHLLCQENGRAKCSALVPKGICQYPGIIIAI